MHGHDFGPKSSSPRGPKSSSPHKCWSTMNSLHSLPELRELQPSTELGALQSQTERNRLKWEEVEAVLKSMHKSLAETRNGLEDVKSKLGTFELEHRFTLALRASSLKESGRTAIIHHDSSSGTMSPGLAPAGGTASIESSMQLGMVVGSARLEAVEAAYQDIRLNTQEVPSMPEATEQLLKCELNHAVAHLHEELQVARNEEAEQCTADLVRAEAAGAELRRRLEEAEQQIQAVYTSEVVETRSLMEVAVRKCDQHISKAEEFQVSLKAEVRQELDLLSNALQQEHSKVVQNSVGVSRAEVVGSELSQRMEVQDLRIQDLQQALEGQGAEANVLDARLEAAARDCSEQLTHASELRAFQQDEHNQRVAETTDLTMRLDALEQSVRDSIDMRELISRIERLEDGNNPSGSISAGSSTVQEAATSEATSSLLINQMAAQLQGEQEALIKRLEDSERALEEVRTSWLDEASALSGRIEEVAGMHKQQVTGMQELGSRLCEEVAGMHKLQSSNLEDLCSRLVEETDALHSRVHTVEEQLSSGAGSAGALSSSVNIADAASLTFSVPPAELPGAQSNMSLPAATSSATSPTATPTVVPDSVIDELRLALKTTCGDVAVLARNIATVREEHDAAITSIGTLTEFVARAAATSIQRTEELARQREELDHEVSVHCEATSGRAKSEVVEGGEQDSSTTAGGSKEGAGTSAHECVRLATAGHSADPAAQAAAAAEERITAVEQVLGADLQRIGGMLASCVEQLEATQLDVHDLQPRVKALEAAAGTTTDMEPSAALPRRASGSVGGIAVEGTPCRREASPRPADVSSKPPLAAPAPPENAATSVMGSPPFSMASPMRTLGGSPVEAALGPGCSPLSCRMRSPPVGSRWVEDPISIFMQEATEPMREFMAGQGAVGTGGLTQVGGVLKLPASAGVAFPEGAAGLKEKLEGIVSSVHHVLGALNLGETQLLQMVQPEHLPQRQVLQQQQQQQPQQPEPVGGRTAEAQALNQLPQQQLQQQQPVQPQARQTAVKNVLPALGLPNLQRDPSLRMVGNYSWGSGGTASPQTPAFEQWQTVHSQAPRSVLRMQSARCTQLPPSEKYRGQELGAHCLQPSHSEKYVGGQEQAARLQPSQSEKHLGGQEHLSGPQQQQSSPASAGPGTLHAVQRSSYSPPPALGRVVVGVSSLPLRGADHSPPPPLSRVPDAGASPPSPWHPDHSPLPLSRTPDVPQQVGSIGPPWPRQHEEGLPGPPLTRRGPHSQSQRRLSPEPGVQQPSLRTPHSPKGLLQMGVPPPVVRQSMAQQRAAGIQSPGQPACPAAVHLQGVSPAMMGALKQLETASPMHSNRNSLNSKRSDGSGAASGHSALPAAPGGGSLRTKNNIAL